MVCVRVCKCEYECMCDVIGLKKALQATLCPRTTFITCVGFLLCFLRSLEALHSPIPCTDDR